MDDEDERIRDAVQEAEEKRIKEESEKENKMRKLIKEQAEHRNMQVSVFHKHLKNEPHQEKTCLMPYAKNASV